MLGNHGLRVRLMRHWEVCSMPYDVFSAVVQTRQWGYGFRVHNWRDRRPAPNEWALRVMFWRWHLIVGLRQRQELGGGL
jgi:hypothetical protein